MSARVLMVQGTASHVGKSLLVTGLCRLFAQAGVRVAPFKAQNMALNSYVTKEGGEIGRAQAAQAEAAMVAASVDMNPILLKPKGDGVSQVVIHGRPVRDMRAGAYWTTGLDEAWAAVKTSLARLRAAYDLVIIEGAGSPAEVNLRSRDLANMRVALEAQAPVLLVGDVERGGIFAALLGTLDLLAEHERALVAGLIVNKFRGDRSLFAEGVRYLEARSGLPVLGVLPWLPVDIDAEDSLSLPDQQPAARPAADALDLVVVRHPHIANFTDLDTLRRSPGVRLHFVTRPEEVPNPDAIILPGTKNAVDDLQALRASGLAGWIRSEAARGTAVVGLCGGLQMMGAWLDDPQGLEGTHPGRSEGLQLLPLATRFRPGKVTHQAVARVASGEWQGLTVKGYEIHSGESWLLEQGQPFLEVTSRSQRAVAVRDGAWVSPGCWGTYFHGIFDNVEIRRRWLNHLRARRGWRPLTEAETEAQDDRAAQFDRLAEALRNHLDLDRIWNLAALER